MASIINKLHSKGLIKPPSFVVGGTQYETVTGSESYGVATDFSDKDIVGFCIPPKGVVFPHLAGEIEGFGRQHQRFGQFQQHHIKTETVSYDVTIYNIIKYFQLCMENNPNMIDSLFTDRACVLFSTKIADEIRSNRKIFLHKGYYHKTKGYSFSRMNKMRTKKSDVGSKRYKSVMEIGFDVKYAYHIVRLLNQSEQVLLTGDLDLKQNNRQLIAIRNGELSIKQIEDYFYSKEKQLEELYVTSTAVPHSPPEEKIKTLLLNCLEEYYGSLSGCIENQDKYKIIVRDIQRLVQYA